MDEGADPVALGEAIRRHRLRLLMSQQDLAERAGVSVRTVRNLERGQIARPRPASLRMLAAALGVDDLAAPAAPAAPALLPWDVRAFTGRADELARLDDLLLPVDGPMPITVVTGTAGVGKTALAVRWAHRALAEFPGGQLYADLRGYAPEQPADPQDVLGGFLRRLGVDPAALPADAAERAALYRSVLADRRTLVVLDNASSAEQVRPLLPGSASCSVLVTSRDSLSALVARDGARRVALDLLPPADALDLLRTLLGTAVDADPAAAAELVRACARLPLALRIVADHVTLTGRDLAGVVAELGDRLAVLEADGDPRTAVRSVFSWSVGALPPAAARAFRLLGLHPGADLDDPALAALLGVEPARATELADRLVRGHLLHRDQAGRLGMHDLLRAYAAERVSEDDEAEREAALDRLADHLLWTALAVADVLAGLPAQEAPVPVVRPATEEAAAGWLDAERPMLGWVAARLAASDRAPGAVELVSRLWQPLYLGGHSDTLALAEVGLRAARRTGDTAAEGALLSRLGMLHTRAGDYSEAVRCGEAAIAVFHAAGARLEEARALNSLGVAYKRWGRLDDALRAYERALPVFRAAGRLDFAARTTDNIGLVYELRDDFATARDRHAEALALALEVGDRDAAARARANLAQSLTDLGDLADAAKQAEQALVELVALGDRDGEAWAYDLLGRLALESGRPDDAVELGHRALRLHREMSDRDGVVEADCQLGDAYRQLGDLDTALLHHRAALELATALGVTRRRATALNGIGECLTPTDPAAALDAFDQALAAASEASDGVEHTRALRGRTAALAAARP